MMVIRIFRYRDQNDQMGGSVRTVKIHTGLGLAKGDTGFADGLDLPWGMATPIPTPVLPTASVP